MPMSKRFLVTTLLVAAVAMYGNVPRAQTQAKEQPAATAKPVRPAASTQARPAATKVTTPMAEWGHNIGDDYFLANYQQLMGYWKKLEKESPRLRVQEIGKTSEGRPMLMAVITSPANHQKLERYKTIAGRLANAEGLTDEAARALAKEGKAVVWIDGGLHANETLGAQQLIEHVYQMVSRTDEETMRFLDDVIQLCVLVNPDGMDLVSDWYMQRGTMTIPVLYNRYAGHDDNRDFYMAALVESTNINRIMYREWYPQIMYNHHQTGPQGTVMFAPPFRDPYNYYQHPYAIAGIDVVGAMMQERFLMEGKPGVTQRKGAPVLDVVQRRHPHDGALPQHDRHPDRDHRQPRSDQHSLPPGQAARRLQSLHADQAAGGMAHAAIDRVFDDGQPRHPRLRLALSREGPLQHLQDGERRD